MAAGFPTTVNPILQNGLVPVFVDVDDPHLQRRRRRSSRPRFSPRTRAIMLAHTLGNPFDLRRGDGLRQAARPLADRGLLRRRRLHLPRPQGGHVRRPGHRQLLSRPPHHHGRRRRVLTNDAAAARRWSNRSATGAATAGASPATTTPAASASTGSWASCPAATITSTPTRTSATT